MPSVCTGMGPQTPTVPPSGTSSSLLTSTGGVEDLAAAEDTPARRVWRTRAWRKLRHPAVVDHITRRVNPESGQDEERERERES